MIVTYADCGARHWDRRPYPRVSRPVYECCLSLAGAIAPDLARPVAAAERRLWLFAPGHRHGWRMPRGAQARIVVVHMNDVPPPLASAVAAADGMLSRDLSAAQADRWRELVVGVMPHLPAQGALSLLRYQLVLCELALLLLDDQAGDAAAGETTIVSQALGWYAAHLHEGPSQVALARAMGFSVAHLRRLFHQVRGVSPQAACLALRMERAGELLRAGELDGSAIAAACGYADAPSFCRAFKRVHGCSPQAWLHR